jgi:hypothetical protein
MHRYAHFGRGFAKLWVLWGGGGGNFTILEDILSFWILEGVWRCPKITKIIGYYSNPR